MKTTKKDFELFKSECRKWVERFGLKEWEIEFEHKYADGCRGELDAKTVNRTALITLSTDWGKDPVSNEKVRMVAFHEICELLLAPVRANAEYRYSSYNDIDESLHAVIRTLENVVWK